MDFADGVSDEIDCHNYTIFDSRRTDRSDAKHEIKISEAHSEDPDEIEAVKNLIHRSFEDSSSGLLSRFEGDLLSGGTYSSIHSQHSPKVLNKSFIEGDTGIEQPSLEYDESWKLHMYEVKSPDVSSDEPNQKHKIVLRDLSFDDNAPLSELTRIDLLCPVFLAVTEDEDDNDQVLKDIRRKTKSIENLASTWDDDQGMLLYLLFLSQSCHSLTFLIVFIQSKGFLVLSHTSVECNNSQISPFSRHSVFCSPC